jgi:hypothetical protein
MEDLLKQESILKGFKFIKKYVRSIGRDSISASIYIYRGGDYDNNMSIYTRSDVKIPEIVESFFRRIAEYFYENYANDFDEDIEHNIEFEYNITDNEFRITNSMSIEDTEQQYYEDDIDSPELIELMDSLVSQGTTTIKVEFTGGGDSGYIESNGYNQDDVQIGIPALIEDYLYDMLSNHQSGWEINEGSQGNFEISCNRKVISLNLGVNYERVETDEIFRTEIKDN